MLQRSLECLRDAQWDTGLIVARFDWRQQQGDESLE
jgi:hypothetical protein